MLCKGQSKELRPDYPDLAPSCVASLSFEDEQRKTNNIDIVIIIISVIVNTTISKKIITLFMTWWQQRVSFPWTPPLWRCLHQPNPPLPLMQYLSSLMRIGELVWAWQRWKKCCQILKTSTELFPTCFSALDAIDSVYNWTSSVTLDCQVTKIVMNSGSELSEL